MGERKEFEYYIITGAMLLLVLMGVLQILFRFVLNFSLSWTEELSRYLFILMVYTGASLALKRKKHVRVELIDIYVKSKIKRWIFIFNDIVMIWLLLLVGYAGLKISITTYEMEQLSPALGLPMYLVYGIIPLTFLFGACRAFQVLIVEIKGGKE